MTKQTKKTQQLKLGRQSGLSLIELMIALGLGIFLLSGMLQTAVSNKQAFDMTQASSSVQDSSRFSFEFISTSLRSAGFVNAGSIDNDFSTSMLSINNVNAYYQTYWDATANFEQGAVIRGTDTATSFFAGAKANTDAVSVRLRGDPDNPMLDCEGVAIVADPDPIVARTEVPTEIAYYVDANNNLVCDVAGARTSGAILLVNGVEDMQVTYGLSDTFGTPTRYVSATDIAAGEWAQVTTVSLSILARSESSPLDKDSSTTPYTMQDSTVNVTKDGRSRMVFSYTITLRNRISPQSA